MITSIDKIMSYLSSIMSLKPRDVILTRQPGGDGIFW
ncbi:hypothetical protein [Lentibacillus amyloliquefaciens]